MPTTLQGGRYVLVRKLGEGSQGETYEATIPRAAGTDLAGDFRRYVAQARAGVDAPRSSSELVAIKCFRIATAKEWKDVELAEREARTLALLDHPNLPRYIEHFEEDGALYLVMEKIEGESLAVRQPLGAPEIVRMIRDIGAALGYLHARAPVIVHRDVKPSNVIRRPDGSFALVDFGAVRDRLKPQGGSTVVGTFGFMAPEQFQGRAGPRSDLYGLGATAIAMLTGEQPEELPHRGLGIDVAKAVPAGTPKAIVRALEAMLAADPEERAGSIEDVLGILEERERGLDQRARREVRREAKRARRQRKRRARRVPWVFGLIARLGMLVALMVVWVVLGVVVPAVLGLLALVVGRVFGKGLGRGAAASIRAARKAQEGVGKAAGWMQQGTRVRVAEDVREIAHAHAHEDEDEHEDEHEDDDEHARKRAK